MILEQAINWSRISQVNQDSQVHVYHLTRRALVDQIVLIMHQIMSRVLAGIHSYLMMNHGVSGVHASVCASVDESELFSCGVKQNRKKKQDKEPLLKSVFE